MYNLYWGETHDNTHQAPDPDFSMDRHLKHAASHLDFYCGAYYPCTSPAFRKGGHPSDDTSRQPLNVETWKPDGQLASEWSAVKEAIRRNHREGHFVIFPGFEWQGDGTWGDHNVFYCEDDPPLQQVETLRELYDRLRSHRALAIPHHTAYITGFRGKNWDVQDDELSPFMEIFSIHGCSEGEAFGGGLRSNAFLGPDITAGAFTDAITRGHRVGIIASTDNWGPMPGHYGWGLAGVWAESLTRESLFEAFRARRVYGVSGDRIRLQVLLNDHPMGSVLPRQPGPPVFLVRVESLDRIDYVELVRDEVLLDRVSILGESNAGFNLSREFLLRLEYGWGPAANVLPLPPKDWHGSVSVSGGEVTEAVPCWISPGQKGTLDGGSFSFSGRTTQETAGEQAQNGFVLKLRGRADSVVTVEIDGIKRRATIQELSRASTVLWDRKASAKLIRENFGTDAEALARKDVLFGMACKAKIHQVLPSTVFRQEISFTDELYDGQPHSYRVRVRQRNGQMAWSSPFWLE